MTGNMIAVVALRKTKDTIGDFRVLTFEYFDHQPTDAEMAQVTPTGKSAAMVRDVDYEIVLMSPHEVITRYHAKVDALANDLHDDEDAEDAEDE